MPVMGDKIEMPMAAPAGIKKGSGAAHQQELRPTEDQLGDVPVPPRGPGAREGAGIGSLQDFLPNEH